MAPERPGEFIIWGVINGITSAAKRLSYANDGADMATLAGSVLGAAVASRSHVSRGGTGREASMRHSP